MVRSFCGDPVAFSSAVGRRFFQKLRMGSVTFEPQALHSKVSSGEPSEDFGGEYSTSHMGTPHVGQIGCFGLV
jgi:hypothetical protein